MVEVARHSRWGPRGGNQLYYGPIVADSHAIRNIGRLGQGSPYTRERMRSYHGRYLSGLGGESMSGAVGYDAAYQGQDVYELEAQDDTFGSGIFDPGGRGGTANANMGIMASHYSLPGYAAREVPFAVSREVSDITDDAQVVYVPGGGMSYTEVGGRLRAPAVLGPTWRPPGLEVAGETTHDQVYAFLGKPGRRGRPPLNPNAPVVAPPTYEPGRQTNFWQREVPAQPGSCGVPGVPGQHTVPKQSIVVPQGQGIAVRPPPGACAGFGQEAAPKEPPSAGKLLIAGAIVGGATALLVSVVKKRKRR